MCLSVGYYLFIYLFFRLLLNAIYLISEKCPDLIKPSDGNVLLSSNGSVSSAIFECLSGYEIYGERELTCQENGTWNYAAPSCGRFGIQGIKIHVKHHIIT